MTEAKKPKQIPEIRFPGLVKAILIRRRKRFLIDAALKSGKMITAHCPNTGSMQTCCEPGREIYLSTHSNPARKYPYTFEMIRMPDSFVGVNTLLPNRLVAKGIESGYFPELVGYDTIQKEKKTETSSRIDLFLHSLTLPSCFIEIKNVTLVQNRKAFFPDAVTTRGQKHLKELMRLHDLGYRALLFFLIQRTDAKAFSPEDSIDPEYGRLLRLAHGKGVEILACDVLLDTKRICLNNRVPHIL